MIYKVRLRKYYNATGTTAQPATSAMSKPHIFKRVPIVKHDDQHCARLSIVLPSLALTHLSAHQDYESKLSALKQEVADFAAASEAVQAKNS